METQQIAISDSISWQSMDTGQLKPNQGRTGIHPGYTTSFLQSMPTPRLKTSFVRAIAAKKPSVCSTGASFQSTSNSISKRDLALVKTTVHRRYRAETCLDTWACIHPLAQKHASHLYCMSLRKRQAEVVTASSHWELWGIPPAVQIDAPCSTASS